MTGMALAVPCASMRLAHFSGIDQWRQDRLVEARSILAEAAHHPETLVILAARVVAGQTDSDGERDAAIDLLRPLDRRPLRAVSAAAFPKRGAA